MPFSEIPDEILPGLDKLRTAAAVAFQLQNWEIAASRLDVTYRFLLEQQRRYRARFHKGWELHNAGVALLNVPKFSEGARYIILAYIEDVLSANTGSEDDADRGTAGFVLGGLGVRSGLLNAIKDVARELKAREEIPDDPEIVLTQALQAIGVPRASFDEDLAQRTAAEAESRRKRSILGITSPLSNRCFVGGNYFVGGPSLEDLRHAVVSMEFDAILVDDFDIPSDRVHDDSLRLLHSCSKAVFEISVPAGQLMELERCRDYGIHPLLLRQVRPEADPIVSQMIATMAGVELQAYSSNDELVRLVQGYLADCG